MSMTLLCVQREVESVKREVSFVDDLSYIYTPAVVVCNGGVGLFADPRGETCRLQIKLWDAECLTCCKIGERHASYDSSLVTLNKRTMSSKVFPFNVL